VMLQIARNRQDNAGICLSACPNLIKSHKDLVNTSLINADINQNKAGPLSYDVLFDPLTWLPAAAFSNSTRRDVSRSFLTVR
jgi:hypothetical protein